MKNTQLNNSIDCRHFLRGVICSRQHLEFRGEYWLCSIGQNFIRQKIDFWKLTFIPAFQYYGEILWFNKNYVIKEYHTREWSK